MQEDIDFLPILKVNNIDIPIEDGQLILSSVIGEKGIYVDIDGERQSVVGEGSSIFINNQLQSAVSFTSDPQTQLTALATKKTYTYAATAWIGSTAPYNIVVSATSHGLGLKARIVEFNDGNGDDFEWRRDLSGNITIYSNVKVPITVCIKN